VASLQVGIFWTLVPPLR